MRLDEQRKPLPTEGLPLTAAVEPFEEAPGRFGHKGLSTVVNKKICPLFI